MKSIIYPSSFLKYSKYKPLIKTIDINCKWDILWKILNQFSGEKLDQF